MKFKGWLNEDIIVPINIGDVVLGGKFKNKKITVKKIGKNPKGDITINGKPLLKYRTLPKKIDEQVTNDEATGFVNKWKAKLKSYGVTEFKLSTHFLLDRMNHKRNVPSITVDEMDLVMDGFLRKMGSQFAKDVENVRNHTAKKRGANKNQIPSNEYEFTISSNSNKVNFIFVLKQDHHKKGTAIVLPMTILRKKKFKITKGDHIIVERRELWI